MRRTASTTRGGTSVLIEPFDVSYYGRAMILVSDIASGARLYAQAEDGPDVWATLLIDGLPYGAAIEHRGVYYGLIPANRLRVMVYDNPEGATVGITLMCE